LKPLHAIVIILLLLLLGACTRLPAPAPEPVATPAPSTPPVHHDRLFERVNELEHARFAQIWQRLDPEVAPAQAVEQFAHAQAFLHALSARPASRNGLPPAGTGPVISPRMEARFGPAFVTEWYERIVAWREHNKPALMQRLHLNEREVDALLWGHFRIGSPWEQVLVAWGNPSRVNQTPGPHGSSLDLLYGNGQLRRVIVTDGVVSHIVD